MRLGVKQVLTVVKIVDFGVYLGSDEERVLLPKKQVPEGIEVGDPIEVFLSYTCSLSPLCHNSRSGKKQKLRPNKGTE